MSTATLAGTPQTARAYRYVAERVALLLTYQLEQRGATLPAIRIDADADRPPATTTEEPNR